MNKYKKLSIRKVLFTVLSAALLCCAFIGYGIFGGKKSNALSGLSDPTVGDIYNYEDYCYDEANMNKMAQQILNVVKPGAFTDAKFADLVNYTRNTAKENGTAISTSTVITINYGRYRFTTSASSTYKSLTWMPVYLSTNSNNEAILTLYLAATSSANGSTSMQEVGAFSHDKTYSTNYSHPMPSNSYGTSYIRAYHLGNNGVYVSYPTNSNGSHDTTTIKKYDSKVNETTCNKFNDFIEYFEAAKPDETKDISGRKYGLLYEDLAVPAEMKWQATESAVDWIKNAEDEPVSPYGDYCWPNESYGVPHAGSYYKDTFNYQTNEGYTEWKNDKVWLPSLTEVGTGNIDVNGTDTTNGVWKLTAEQRANTAKTYSWLRTANVAAKKTGDYSTYTMFALDDKGAVIDLDVNETAGIRPAIHLNLSKIVSGNKMVAPVNLPDTVYSQYVGDFQSMAVIPEDQKKWYIESEMSVKFYADAACSRPTVPLNAGEYYIRAELDSKSKRYFRGTDGEKFKVSKFIVEKSKLYVTWFYEDETKLKEPTRVEIDGEFYDRDIKTGNIPEISMVYTDVSGGGLQNWPEYPDKKGVYTASACIVDEEKHNYNYELAGSKEKPLTSYQFEVLEKEIDLPYFVENKDVVLNKTYKGTQYVQIANINPKYVEILIGVEAVGSSAADKEAASQAARDKIVDRECVNGVQTYSLESVAAYTFTVRIKDPENTKWKSGEEGKDDSDKELRCNIEKAEITVSFNGLPSSWGAATEVSFSLDVIGVYQSGSADDAANNVEFSVAYYTSGGYLPNEIPREDNGKYVFRAGSLKMGEYYIYVVMAGSSAYSSNYMMPAEGVTQKFTVVQTVSDFNAGLVFWQYRLNGAEHSESYAYDAHDSAMNPLELEYVEGGYYEFYLDKTESHLRTQYFVKPDYTGDLSVTDAGLHSITVTINPADKNVVFTKQSYTIYFKIKASRFNISNVKWDYSEPFVYNGEEQKILIDNATLPNGLTVVYRTGGISGNGMTEAGIYNTAVSFKVSDEYAKNYVVPDANDPSTYINNGDFSFVQNWEIKRQEIRADWITDDSSSDLFFVPYLAEGHNKVNYSYERFDGADYVACTSITSTGSAEKYRVTATINDGNKNNYALTGQTSCEFEVAANKFAVTVFVEINGVRSENGAKFVYTGSAFSAAPKVENGSVSIESFTVGYYNSVSGSKGTILTSAPVNAGSYIAVIKTEFSASGSSASFSSETEFAFEVEKADLDFSNVRWEYSKNGVTKKAWFDSDQKKFVDSEGNESVFAFEYDGTNQIITLAGADSVTGLTIGGVSNNSKVNAGNYTAYLTWEYNAANYNEPAFPKSFGWSVTQARIDFNSVKWGYIDENGDEHEFGENGAKFLFTRDENKKAVKFTVALINLPSYIKNLFKYSTTSYTDREFGSDNDGVESGSSFFNVGEYNTVVSISGVYNDPTGNTKPFTAADFPPNIIKNIDWEIEDRELSSPQYDGTWTKFDNKTHNLVRLCGMPENELNYFKVEIVFMNNNNELDNDYQGYNGVPYTAFDAGEYTVMFHRLGGENGESGYIWGQATIKVEKGELTVTWDSISGIPVARVKGVYVSDRLETKYYIVFTDSAADGTELETRGAEVDVEYIKTTDYAKYEAEPAITKEYANNIEYKMDGEAKVFPFTYIRFIVDENTQAIDKPVMAVSQIEYTGSEIQFAVSNWTFFKDYLYILEGDEALFQKDVGVYRISVAFRKRDGGPKIGNAYWRGSSPEDPDRSTYVLTFEITPPTNQPLDYPSFMITTAEKTGGAIEFTITNWLLMQDYVEYEVFYNNDSLGKNIPLSFTEAGIYTVVFSIPQGSIGSWQSDPDNPKKDYSVQLQIVDPNVENKTIFTPVITNNSQAYTGGELSFTIDYWDSANLSAALPVGVTMDGKVVKATDIGSYTITVTITAPDVTFADGSKTCKLTFTVASPGDDVTAPLPKPVFVSASASYTGNEIEFRIDSWKSIYGKYIEITLVTCTKEGAPVSVDQENGTIKATVAGTYTVTIGFKEGANAKWLDTKDKEPATLTFTISEKGPGTPDEIPEPSFEKPSLEFTGKEINFEIKNWSTLANYVSYEVFTADGKSIGQNLSPQAVGVYTVVLKIKDGVDKTFEGGLKEKRLTFEIKKANLTLKLDEEGKPVIKDNMPVFVNSDGVEVILDGYFTPVYKDPDTGETVPPDKLEPGKNYDVTYTVNDDKKEEFNSSVNNYEEVNERMGDTYNFSYQPPKQGLDLIWIILIVIAVIVVIVLIIVIALVVRRRSNGGDYDDYDNDYDDEDYDDDYDDEDYDDDYDDEDYDDDYDEDY